MTKAYMDFDKTHTKTDLHANPSNYLGVRTMMSVRVECRRRGTG
jgi:hypothetical protein